jgi:hypothetical protein
MRQYVSILVVAVHRPRPPRVRGRRPDDRRPALACRRPPRTRRPPSAYRLWPKRAGPSRPRRRLSAHLQIRWRAAGEHPEAMQMTPHSCLFRALRRNTDSLLSSALLSDERRSALGQVAGTILHPFRAAFAPCAHALWPRPLALPAPRAMADSSGRGHAMQRAVAGASTQ